MRQLAKATCLALMIAAHSTLAEPLTDSEKQTLRASHDAYVEALAERNSNPGHIESSFAIAMQKHAEASRLAMKIGKENKSDAIPFLLDLKDQDFLRSFVNSYTAPTTPEVEALVLRHLQDPSLHPPEMSPDVWALIHQYHSRALYEALLAAIKEELGTPPNPRNFFGKYGLGGAGYLVQAIVKTDLPEIEADLTAILPRLDTYSGMPVARLLAQRRYPPAEAALIDFLRRTPTNTNNQMLATSASIILPFGSQAVQDAVVRQMIAISHQPPQPAFPGQPEYDVLTKRDQDISSIVGALEISPPWLKLNRTLLNDKAIQGFTQEQAKKIVAMMKVREREEDMADDLTPDNLAHWAQASSRNDMLRIFIKRGVDVNAAPKSGERALIVAVSYFNFEGMRLLLDAGADPNMKDRMGRTALWILSGDKSFDDNLDAPALLAAKNLIEKGADASAAVPGGWTALHNATAAKFKKMVELLVESGAHVNAECFEHLNTTAGLYGLTPLQLAEDQGSNEIAAYLRSKGAITNYSFRADRAAQRAKAAVIAPFLGNMH